MFSFKRAMRAAILAVAGVVVTGCFSIPPDQTKFYEAVASNDVAQVKLLIAPH
jgi:hypothetical protein